MGIKFRNRVTAGAPVDGDIKERELCLDLKNGSIYSSNDGTDIIKLDGEDERGGVIHLDTTTYAIGDIVTNDDMAYICIALPTPNPGAFDVADWKKTFDGGSWELVMVGSVASYILPNTNGDWYLYSIEVGGDFTLLITTDFSKEVKSPTTSDNNASMARISSGREVTYATIGGEIKRIYRQKVSV